MFEICDRLPVKIELEVDDPTISQSIEVKRENKEPIEGREEVQSKKLKSNEATDKRSNEHETIHLKKKHTCEKCGKLFKNLASLTTHLKLHSEKTPFQCDKCEKAFKVKKSLWNHQLKHTNSEKWFKCNQCDYSTPYKRHFENHKVVHYNAKPIKCDLCEATLKNQTGLKIHISNIHSESNCLYKCEKCDYSTKIKRYMQRHMLCRHGEKRHKCRQCDYSTAILSSLKLHMLGIHTKEKRLKCEQCDKFFKRVVLLQNHINWKHSDRKFKCEQCDYSTATKEHLKKHTINRHTERKVLQCDICDFSCLEKKTLKKHVQKHTGLLESLKCDLCDKIYFGKHRLYMHKRKVHFDKELKCTQCDFRTPYPDALKYHILLHSGKKLKCAQCDYTCLYKKPMDEHRLSKHVSTRKKWRCDTSGCRYATSVKIHLNNHKKYTHKLEKSVKCHQCDLEFKTGVEMRRHASTHTKNKPFKCEKCKFSSATKTQLRVHARSKHRNEKKHKCDECGDSYNFVEDLENHKVKHDEIKNFKCHLCPDSMRRKESLTRHLKRKHSNQLNYKCGKCDGSFSTPYSLWRHQFVHSKANIYRCYLCEYRTHNPRYLRQHILLKSHVTNSSNGEKCEQCGLKLRDKFDSKVHRDAHRPCFVLMRELAPSLDVNVPPLIRVKMELNEDIKVEIV